MAVIPISTEATAPAKWRLEVRCPWCGWLLMEIESVSSVVIVTDCTNRKCGVRVRIGIPAATL